MNYILIFSSVGGSDHWWSNRAGLDRSAACWGRAANGVGEEQWPEKLPKNGECLGLSSQQDPVDERVEGIWSTAYDLQQNILRIGKNILAFFLHRDLK